MKWAEKPDRRGTLELVNWDSEWQRPMDQKHACETDQCMLRMQLLLPEMQSLDTGWREMGRERERRG